MKSVDWGLSVFIPKIFDVFLGLGFLKTYVCVALITGCCIFIKSWGLRKCQIVVLSHRILDLASVRCQSDETVKRD